MENKQLNIVVKTFNQLGLEELYALLALRSEIFVVEQDCVYQDLDFKDQKALHILGYEQDQLVAYTRLFNAGDYFQTASIGRVLVRESYRSHQYGHRIMEASVKALFEAFGKQTIEISAQQYLLKFYHQHGFVEVGEGYLEDGIPHIKMIRELMQ